jgi:Synaptobrevin/Regulated-SNARE-like domain
VERAADEAAQPSALPNMSQILYLAVARIADKTAVATHAFGGMSQVVLDEKLARVMSSSRINEHGRLTIMDKDVGNIHYDSDPACLYMAVTVKEYPQRLVFKMLTELRTQFEATHANEFNSARTAGLSKKTKQMFTELAKRYESAGGGDKLASVSMQVEEVKGAMQNNINAVLKNQDNLESLLESSSNMRTDATTFQRSAVQAKNRFWWQNTRLMIYIVIALTVLGVVIALPILVNKSKTGR